VTELGTVRMSEKRAYEAEAMAYRDRLRRYETQSTAIEHQSLELKRRFCDSVVLLQAYQRKLERIQAMQRNRRRNKSKGSTSSNRVRVNQSGEEVAEDMSDVLGTEAHEAARLERHRRKQSRRVLRAEVLGQENVSADQSSLDESSIVERTRRLEHIVAHVRSSIEKNRKHHVGSSTVARPLPSTAVSQYGKHVDDKNVNSRSPHSDVTPFSSPGVARSEQSQKPGQLSSSFGSHTDQADEEKRRSEDEPDEKKGELPKEGDVAVTSDVAAAEERVAGDASDKNRYVSHGDGLQLDLPSSPPPAASPREVSPPTPTAIKVQRILPTSQSRWTIASDEGRGDGSDHEDAVSVADSEAVSVLLNGGEEQEEEAEEETVLKLLNEANFTQTRPITLGVRGTPVGDVASGTAPVRRANSYFGSSPSHAHSQTPTPTAAPTSCHHHDHHLHDHHHRHHQQVVYPSAGYGYEHLHSTYGPNNAPHAPLHHRPPTHTKPLRTAPNNNMERLDFDLLDALNQTHSSEAPPLGDLSYGGDSFTPRQGEQRRPADARHQYGRPRPPVVPRPESWTEQEDERLFQLGTAMPRHWETISVLLNRDESSCRHRFDTLRWVSFFLFVVVYNTVSIVSFLHLVFSHVFS